MRRSQPPAPPSPALLGKPEEGTVEEALAGNAKAQAVGDPGQVGYGPATHIQPCRST